MGQGADGDDVHPGFGDGTEGLLPDTAARLEESPAIHDPDGFGHGRAIHIVEHDDVRPGIERLPDLVEVAGLHLEFHHMPELFPDSRHRLGNPAGSVDMVILEHGAVGQIEAVVFPAADGDGVFLQGAQPRQGFAGVGDNSPRSPNLLHRLGGGPSQCPTYAAEG